MTASSLKMTIFALLSFLIIVPCTLAQDGTVVQDGMRYVAIKNPNTGAQQLVPDSRRPALYTGNYGDCRGSSLITVTRFDASYYADNMTILFHLGGTTALKSENLMMYIGVYAYGESRFDLVFNPCSANIYSACPAKAGTPIEANGIIPVSPSDVSGIPPIAMTIPDFEGQAILRIFANSTQSEIACFSAVVTNGVTFSQPSSVGTILGLFTMVAIVASFAAAMYGDSIPVMRTHHAHSLSVGVTFAVFHHIYYSGALSMNWPSVLVAWWSNFAWAAGMINTASMQNSINKLVGLNVGNTSQVGAAGSGTYQANLGGGFNIASIYKRSIMGITSQDVANDIYSADPLMLLKRQTTGHAFEQALQRRALVNSSTGYEWYGNRVGLGLPLPGNYSGFAGTLAQEGIRASNAFVTGFLWFIIVMVLVVGTLVAFKWILEGLERFKILKEDRLMLFRNNWISFAIAAALKICYMSFFMIMFLTMFQFSYASSAGPKALAAIVFIIFFPGTILALAYAYYFRLSKLTKEAQDHELSSIPPGKLKRMSNSLQSLIPKDVLGRSRWMPSTILHSLSELGHQPNSIHEDEDYVKRFGWLSARFRRSRWWFFGAWTTYEFIRACFYGGASGHPKVQVFGLLIVEITAFALFIWARPFEGRRLNILVVYLLGVSKVASVALSAAFDTSFNLPRIATTAIGIIIIVIQGLLTIGTLVAIAAGAISTWMSIHRDKSTEEFKPKALRKWRERYFQHIERTAKELARPIEVKPESEKSPELPNGPYFNVSSVRRMHKIEDDDYDFTAELRQDPSASFLSLDSRNFSPTPSRPFSPLGPGSPSGPSRITSSASSTHIRSNLPFGARAHRPSWSIHDPKEEEEGGGAEERPYVPINMSQTVPDEPSKIAGPTPQLTAIPRTLSRLSSRLAQVSNLSVPKIRPTRSMETMRPAPEIRRPESPLCDVPAPRVRPRSGTWNSQQRASSSRVQSRGGTPSGSFIGLDREGAGVVAGGFVSSPSSSGVMSPVASPLSPPQQPVGNVASSMVMLPPIDLARIAPLTPTQEMDEEAVKVGAGAKEAEVKVKDSGA